MASWLLVAVNIDRLIAVSFLSLSKKWCTPQVAMFVSLFLALSLALINAHLIYFIDSDDQYFTINIIKNESYSNNITTDYLFGIDYSVINIKSNTLPVNPYVYQKCLVKPNYPSYTYFFKNIFTWIDTSLQVIIPFVIMLICNMNIIHQTLFTKRISKGKNLKRLKKIKGMCYMIVTLSVLFFILEAPVLIFISLMQESWKEDESTQLIWTVINLMMYTNHVINFISYCMTGTKFRRELLRLFIIKTTISTTFSKFSSLYSTKNKTNKANNHQNQIINKQNGTLLDQDVSIETKKQRKKNLHVNFETQKEISNNCVLNNNKVDTMKDAELEFILNKIKTIESDNSTDSNPSVSNSRSSSLRTKISFKLKTFSKRKVINANESKPDTKAVIDYDDIDIEMDDDDDID